VKARNDSTPSLLGKGLRGIHPHLNPLPSRERKLVNDLPSSERKLRKGIGERKLCEEIGRGDDKRELCEEIGRGGFTLTLILSLQGRGD
jgi:hypothetical protein